MDSPAQDTAVAQLVIAGTHSGVGKTTITMGLTAALRKRGLVVQPFKVGPDYIDPAYHSAAAGRPCRNLDSWLLEPERLLALFAHATQDADLALIEGVMGVHDGLGYDSSAGSTGEVARMRNAAVVLVLDISKMARSAAAMAVGYQRFDPALRLAGFILNRAGSERHALGVKRAIEQATGLPVVGWLPRTEALAIPERHLGLAPVIEREGALSQIESAGEMMERHLDIDALLELAGGMPGDTRRRATVSSGSEEGWEDAGAPVIAVARDAAFQFVYKENLELLQEAGGRVVAFSPLEEEALPGNTAGVLLSGGFPEMHAGRLAANVKMRKALRAVGRGGVPIYAECGGLMYLCESLVDLEGREWPMVGLLPGRSRMQPRLTLGYRLARATCSSWLMHEGEMVRGHEFHYSQWDGQHQVEAAFDLLPIGGNGEPRQEGACAGTLWASYVHLHWWSKPALAERFVAACKQAAGIKVGRR